MMPNDAQIWSCSVCLHCECFLRIAYFQNRWAYWSSKLEPFFISLELAEEARRGDDVVDILQRQQPQIHQHQHLLRPART